MSARATRFAVGAVLAALLVVVGFELFEEETWPDAAARGGEPAVVEPIGTSGLSRVTLTASAAQRIGLSTARVEARGSAKTVPYSALLYDERGRTWVYTSPQRLTFVRAPVVVRSIRSDVALLAAGPPAGAAVATVGVAELYGAELGVDH
jgi:hypothetical protein